MLVNLRCLSLEKLINSTSDKNEARLSSPTEGHKNLYSSLATENIPNNGYEFIVKFKSN